MGTPARAPDAAHPPPGAEGRTIRIEIFSDVVCPWCYIGARRLASALRRLRDDPTFEATVETVYRPFVLDPGAPLDRSEPVADVYARKFGGAARAAEMIASITETAATEGLEFHLDRARRANTINAHRMLWFTLWRHGPQAQAALNESLMQAYFCAGGDLGDPDLLYRLAVDAGVTPADARRVADTEEGLEAVAVGLEKAAGVGITSVPTYVVDSVWAVPGAQDPAVFERVLRRRADPERTD